MLISISQPHKKVEPIEHMMHQVHTKLENIPFLILDQSMIIGLDIMVTLATMTTMVLLTNKDLSKARMEFSTTLKEEKNGTFELGH